MSLNPDGNDGQRAKALKLLSVILCIFFPALAAYSSDPSYDPTHSQGYEWLTGYELSEEGVRDALDNFDSLRIDKMHATIAVVGEQRYTALTGRLKEIYAREPLVRSDHTDLAMDEYLRLPLFLDTFKVLVVRALIRCGDPDAGALALKEVARGESTQRGYAVRNLKYLALTDSDVDVVAELTAMVERDRSKTGMARAAARELAELEHYFRLFADPRRVACSDALDKIMEDAPKLLWSDIEGARKNPRPTWRDTYRPNMPRPIMPDEYPILDAIVDYLLNR